MSELISSIGAILGGFQWYDILDIAIVSFIIYKVIGFLRETRAEQLIKGILVIALAYVVSYYLNLHVMNFLIDILIKNSFVALVVIFHPEFRKALEHMGNSRLSKISLFGSEDHDREKSIYSVNSVIEAFKQLQMQKMGALVVFEQKSRLNEIVQTGTIVDAAPNASVISNIFFNKAPLHDGAMIIRNNRIYAAGCILPLTPNNNIDQNLGTRHRAAIGMSENSDAVIAILSEENGVMSIAYKGQITRFSSVIEFSSMLVSMVAPEKTDQEKRKKFSIASIKQTIAKPLKKIKASKKGGKNQ